ncbi:MAG: metallophosphoesterase [Thermoleophilia bacterium]|nr:metallophosphoesterase [Thermoleophilia bacterium]
MLKLFYVTDIHGSNVCYRKFLNALPIYGADVAVLNGDLLGKVLVPLVEKAGGRRECHLMGQYTEMTTPDEVAATKRVIENAGYYWVEQTREEYAAVKNDQAAIDALFKKRAVERIEEWLTLADERLAGKDTTVFICPGNDDWWEIDDMIIRSKTLRPCDDTVVEFDGFKMVSSSRSNPTPWGTPREGPEEELTEYLEQLCQKVGNSPRDFENVIFNFHVPPYGYSLDLCPKLDANMRMAAEEKIHAGSLGAKQVIEKYQPLLGLHGHIHESRGAQKAGRTLLINPGSEYSEGILKGVMVMLDKKKVKDYVFTSG